MQLYSMPPVRLCSLASQERYEEIGSELEDKRPSENASVYGRKRSLLKVGASAVELSEGKKAEDLNLPASAAKRRIKFSATEAVV
jgi:hypothetical protein